MSECNGCGQLSGHGPGCRVVRDHSIEGKPCTEAEFLEATVKSGFLSEADASAYAETRRKMFVPILPPRTPWISQSLLDSCTEDAEPYGPGGPVCTCWASDEGDPTPDDHAQMCHADVHSSPVYIPSMDLAKPLPDGYWWCDECSASREKGHSCYERKSW